MLKIAYILHIRSISVRRSHLHILEKFTFYSIIPFIPLFQKFIGKNTSITKEFCNVTTVKPSAIHLRPYNCFKKSRCVKCPQSHLTSECIKSSDTPAKCSNCSGNHPASYSQCPAYTKFLAKRTQITLRDNTAILTLGNKNLHANNRNIISRNLETQEISPNRRVNPLANTNRNINRAKEKLYTPPKSFAAVANKTNLTINNDISEFTGLISEIQKLKQIVNHI